MTLDIIILPTYDVETIAVLDNSTYDTSPPVVTTPTIEISAPGFDEVSLTFTVEETNVFNSTDLGITSAGEETDLPDGVYCLKYWVEPEATYYVEKSIMRIDKIQKKFDEAFMKLDMMECDRAIRRQSMFNLTTIWLFIQGSVAAANNCANVKATSLYTQADSMLDNILNSECSCCDDLYRINFY